MSDKVRFVDRSKKTIFECDRDEAVLAMSEIEKRRLEFKDIREQADELRSEFRELLDKIPKIPMESHVFHLKEMTVFVIEDMFKIVELQGLTVSHIFVDAAGYARLRGLSPCIMEKETKAWKLRAGYLANIWGSKVVVSRDISKNDIVLVASKQLDGHSVGTNLFVRWNLSFMDDSVTPSLDSRMEKLESIVLKIARKVGVKP